MRFPRRCRILCLWFPEWPIQRLIAARPQLERQVLLLTESTSRGEVIRYCNGFARRRGVREAMPVSEARTLAHPRDRFVQEAVRREADMARLRELALQCERYSFCVGLEEAAAPECLLLDVTGIAHFFGGESSLADDFQRQLVQWRLDGRIAIAGTIGAAWAAAHFLARHRQPVVVSDDNWPLVDSWPVSGLRLPETTLAKLHRLGLLTIGEIRGLDRAALIRRFGHDIPLRLDQLTGQREELITPCRPSPRYQVEQCLEEGITHPETICQLWSDLLRQLLETLRPRNLGTRCLKGLFQCENQTSTSFVLRLCDATSDLRHLSDLMRFQVERLRWEAPLVRLRLEALDVSPLAVSQREFFDASKGDHARQFSMLLNRLGSRLGEKAVVVPHLLSDPVPERAVRWVSVADESTSDFSNSMVENLHVLDRPTVLFPEPKTIDVVAVVPDGPPAVVFMEGLRLEVTTSWGPERIESGWWQVDYIRRDYYRVETVLGQRLWVFKLLRDGRWFWHGEW